jgi:hypothetical protein
MTRKVLLLGAIWLAAGPGPAAAEIVDRIVAVVGGRTISWSAVYEEACYQAFRKGSAPPAGSAAEPLTDGMRDVLSILIDQALLQQALTRSPFAPSGNGQSEAGVQEIAGGFATEQQYREALARYRLSEGSLRSRLERERMFLDFVDATLRSQVRLTPGQAESYYRDVFLRDLRASGNDAAAPPLEDVRDQIEEILTQQQINALLDQWLAQMRRTTAIERWAE